MKKSTRWSMFYVLRIALCWALVVQAAVLTAQDPLEVGADFKRAGIHPALLPKLYSERPQDNILAGQLDSLFVPIHENYVTLKDETHSYWLSFDVHNTSNIPQNHYLFLGRKNFDLCSFWVAGENSARYLTTVGVRDTNKTQFSLLNGYYLLVNLPPGHTRLYARVDNEIGPAYVSFTLYSHEYFSLVSRQTLLVIGIFMGVLAVSAFFGFQLYILYRDPTYFYYVTYMIAIALREAYNFSIGLFLAPCIQRHTLSFMITASFGMFLRYFLRLWTINIPMDRFLKWYSVGSFGGAFLFYLLVQYGFGAAAKLLMGVMVMSDMFGIVLTVILIARYFKNNLRARITLYAFAPIAIAFMLNLLRNALLIPNYTFLQFAVIIGFLIEVLIFTIAFTRWFRSLETDRNVFQLKLSLNQQEKLLAVQTAEQRVKDRISRDLHDDVAASLSSIRILSKLAQEQYTRKGPDLQTLLERINQGAQSTLDAISDLIWAATPTADYLNDIADRMREYSMKMLDAKDIAYQFDIPRDLPVLAIGAEARRNLFLIFKEALNNALKHSHCTELTVHFQACGPNLCLGIRDNGDGFDQKNLNKGMGLNNMRKRAKEIGAMVYIKSEPGKGTEIEVSLPLPLPD